MAFATGFSFQPGGKYGYQPPYTLNPAGAGGAYTDYQMSHPQPQAQTQPQMATAPQQTVGPTQQVNTPSAGGTFYDAYNGAPGVPNAPTGAYADAFLPDIFEQPYTNLINNAQTMANWSSQAVPGAAAFQAGIYDPNMTAMEQAYAGAAAQLSDRSLAATHNRLAGMFENSIGHGSLAPAFFDATNQANAQLNQMIGQMGTQRQSIAAQLTPFTFGFPIQAGQAAAQGASGLWDMGQNAMYGELNFPMAALGSNTVLAPSIITS